MWARLFLSIMLALIRRFLENFGDCRKKVGVLGRKLLVKVPFSFDFFTSDEFLFIGNSVRGIDNCSDAALKAVRQPNTDSNSF